MTEYPHDAPRAPNPLSKKQDKPTWLIPTLTGPVGILVGSIITGTFSFLDSERDRRHQIKMAALEQRLSAHQEEYSIWWDAATYLGHTVVGMMSC